MIRQSLLCLIAVAATIALFGCGGGDSEGETSVADNGNATEGSTDGAAKGEGSADSKQGGSGNGKADGGEGSAGSQSDRSSTPGANGGSGSGSAGGGSGDGGSDGEGDSSQGGDSADPNKTAFVSRASAICNRGKREGLEGVGEYVQQNTKGGGKQTAAVLEKGIQTALLPTIRRQIGEIRALGAPPGDAKEISAFLAALEQGVADAAKKGGARSGEVLEANFSRSAELARAYGLGACAFGSVG